MNISNMMNMRSLMLACVLLLFGQSVIKTQAVVESKAESEDRPEWRLYAIQGRTWAYSTKIIGEGEYERSYEVVESTDTGAKVKIVDEGGQVGDDGERVPTEETVEIKFTAEQRRNHDLALGDFAYRDTKKREVSWSIEKEEKIKVDAGRFWCELHVKKVDGVKHKRWVSAHFPFLLIKHDYGSEKGELTDLSDEDDDPRWHKQPDLDELEDDEWRLYRKEGRTWTTKITDEYEVDSSTVVSYSVQEIIEVGTRYCTLNSTNYDEDKEVQAEAVRHIEFRDAHGVGKIEPREDWEHLRTEKIEAAGETWECEVYKDRNLTYWRSTEYPGLSVKAVYIYPDSKTTVLLDEFDD